jgi:hypothetical protein
MKIVQFIIIIALTVTSLIAQPSEEKNKEFSISGSFQFYSRESNSPIRTAFSLSPRLGFYVVKGLELEPEVLVMFSDGYDPVYMLNGNVSYNFISAGRSIPFVLIGVGIANTVPILNMYIIQKDYISTVLNLGAGVKAYFTEDVAFRFECRYQKFSGQGKLVDIYYYWDQGKVDARIFTIQFGLSVLL